MRFPRFTWVRCECGCGWEGEDEVTQWLIEEAVQLRIRALDVAASRRTPEDEQMDLLEKRHAELMRLH